MVNRKSGAAARRPQRWRPEHKPTHEELTALADELGPISEEEPASRRVDGAPDLGSGQVFVTRFGRLFHQGWCQTIGDYWDKNGWLYVTSLGLVGTRTPCPDCCVI
jgi:hypothetical protein